VSACRRFFSQVVFGIKKDIFSPFSLLIKIRFVGCTLFITTHMQKEKREKTRAGVSFS